MLYRGIPDISYEFFQSELDRVNSPMAPEGRKLYDILKAKKLTSLGLAQLWREAQYDTDRILLKDSDHNPFNMKVWPEDPRSPQSIGIIGSKPTGVGGPGYAVFDSYESAFKEYTYRITNPAYKHGVYQPDMTLEEFAEVFAPAYEKHPVTGTSNAGHFDILKKLLVRWGVYEDNTMAKHPLFVVLVAGHNSVGDGGNPVERKLTPALARAYAEAFTKAGIPNTWVNPNMYPGGLDGLASATARAIHNADADLVLSLDLHFNGARSGVHCIPAHNRSQNGGMLNTAITSGRVAADVMENNPLDVRLAGAFSSAIVANVPGMTLWGSNGIMPENQTGVGLPASKGGQNSRLAMMAYSAPYQEKAVRLTIEHGGTNDAQRPDFANKCAAAIVAATKVVLADRLGGSPAPDPEPEPPTGDPGNPDLTSWCFGSVGTYRYDPDGIVSKFWLDHGNRTGEFPRLVDVLEGDPKYFLFSNGLVVRVENGVAAFVEELE